MAKVNRLQPIRLSKLRERGYYADGGNLYLQVSDFGTKSWVFRFTLNGKPREMGLGSLTTFDLADARVKARACRKLLDDGIDPIEERKARRLEAKLAAANNMTFAQAALAYIDAHKAGWKNAKHASQWTNTLQTYSGPVFGGLPVQAIDTGLVMRVLGSIWNEKPETASRLRGRIESILDWATVRGLRSGDNPARWKGHLDKLLPARTKVKAVKHHAALPYQKMAGFMAELRQQHGIASLALEFLILTATRTGETIGARPEEFDLNEKVWTVPAQRMKSKRLHRVPLSPRALAIVESLIKAGEGDYVFAGKSPKKPLSNMAMLSLLKRMGYETITAHGFRSSFRDWAAEQTNVARDVAEAALAHTLSDKVEAAYRRGDLFEKRRLLMNQWAKHCQAEKGSGKVIALGRAISSKSS
ncbi:MAG: integrase arm-type DNA-binding domain-containing protein [Burkholderiales bacterium]|nr:integrase arm-type DNA-binding domain-containing protein [Burkholderiales bacterium]